jgi:ribonucleotide reductase alpha subunit
MNIFMEAPTRERIKKMHFYGWKAQLKTGLYYLRTKPAASAQRFTIAPRRSPKAREPELEPEQDEPSVCLSCQG